MLNQRPIAKFLFKEGNKPVTILSPLPPVHSDGGMKQTQVYFWIAEVWRGHDGLADEERQDP
jgi:hypothetical protein